MQPIRLETSPGHVDTTILHMADLEEPRHTDQRLAAMLDRSPIHTMLFSQSGKVLCTNKAALTKLGSPEGHHIQTLVLFDSCAALCPSACIWMQVEACCWCTTFLDISPTIKRLCEILPTAAFLMFDVILRPAFHFHMQLDRCYQAPASHARETGFLAGTGSHFDTQDNALKELFLNGTYPGNACLPST